VEDWQVEDPHNRAYMIRWQAGYGYTEDQTWAAAEACAGKLGLIAGELGLMLGNWDRGWGW